MSGWTRADGGGVSALLGGVSRYFLTRSDWPQLVSVRGEAAGDWSAEFPSSPSQLRGVPLRLGSDSVATVVWRTCPASSGVKSRRTGGSYRRGFTAHPGGSSLQSVPEPKDYRV